MFRVSRGAQVHVSSRGAQAWCILTRGGHAYFISELSADIEFKQIYADITYADSPPVLMRAPKYCTVRVMCSVAGLPVGMRSLHLLVIIFSALLLASTLVSL